MQADLRQLKEQGVFRSRRIVCGPQGVEVEVDGRLAINFCSNDYLGLANHPAIVQAAARGLAQYGVGSGAAHLICGHSSAHHALEQELAEFTGRSKALLFSTGYMANLGIIATLASRNAPILEDRLNHASLIDGAVLARAKLKRYQHLDLADLSDQLVGAVNGLIVTDGVFSMDGDVAPVPALAEIAKRHEALLMVDDAHGFGVLGATGAGTLQHFGLTEQEVPVLMATLGKACGVFGAFVAGPEALIETLLQQARTYIYTTAAPPALAEATRASLKIIRNEHWRREHLRDLSDYFQTGLRRLGYPGSPVSAAIHPIVVGGAQKAADLSEALMQQGCWVGAIRPPTVPDGTARLRVTFSAHHHKKHVDRLLSALASLRA